MHSFKTIYRVVVMGATLAIVVMGWRLYGPSAPQVKSIALKGIELAENFLRPPNEQAVTPAPPLVRQEAAHVAPAAVPQLIATPPIDGARRLSDQSADTQAAAPFAQNVAPPADQDRLKVLLARLTELDIQEPQLVRWGSEGQLFRFRCRATWGATPQYGRHFEAVAAEPVAAVEQVLAKVDAWRTTERIAK